MRNKSNSLGSIIYKRFCIGPNKIIFQFFVMNSVSGVCLFTLFKLYHTDLLLCR